MFETISPDDLDEALLKAVRRHQGKAWSSNADVVSFRTRLLELQNFRCAYCQGLIDLDEVGHRELDHIFPKSATENCSEVKGQSNEFEERQHTFGYPQFTYEPLNIIVACKICNSYKKTLIRYSIELSSWWAMTIPQPILYCGFILMCITTHSISSAVITGPTLS